VTGRLLYAALAGVLLAVLALMWQVTLPELDRAAGGQPPFDLRFTGYSLAEAQAYLGRLTPWGRDIYLEAQHRLDAVLPPVLAVFLVWSFTVLLPRPAALAMALVALAGAVADIAENARVAVLLTAPEPTAALVAAASQATVAKSALDGLALAVFALACLWHSARRLRPVFKPADPR
jgi:hypothetical protein